MIETEHDGVTRYTIRQSWLNKYLTMCPASAMWDVIRFPNGTPPSTATAIGTAMHAGIEVTLLGGDRTAVIDEMTEAWTTERDTPGFKRDPAIPDSQAIQMAARCYKAWENEIYPTLEVTDNMYVEHAFNLKVDERDGEELWIKGTWDAMPGVLHDWKTGSNPSHYSTNELKRKVQATLYTLAAAKLGLVDPTRPVPFKYGVVFKRKTMDCPTQIFTTTRTPQDWGFLVWQMWKVVDAWKHQIEILNNQGWWCSTKFCEHYNGCAGSLQPVPDL